MVALDERFAPSLGQGGFWEQSQLDESMSEDQSPFCQIGVAVDQGQLGGMEFGQLGVLSEPCGESELKGSVVASLG